MARQRIQLARHSYEDRSLLVSAQRLVNLYAEQKPEDSKSQLVLHGTPGLELFATVGTGPIRGMISALDAMIVVSGTSCYIVDSDGSSTLLGSVPGAGQVSMAANSSQVAIVTQNNVYVTNGSVVLDATQTPCTGVAVLDGYGIFAERGSQKIFISGFDDFTSYDATEFTLANSSPDKLASLVAVNRELWAFGYKSIQTYYNSGAADFPFSRSSVGVINRGTESPNSVAEKGGVVYWLGDDLRVYASEGYNPVAISTYPIERQIAGYSSPDTSTAFCYTQEGHTFYVLRFDEATWVYDATTGLWHERQSWGSDTWRPSTYARAWQRHLVGDSDSGDVYELRLDVFTEAGDRIGRLATSSPIFGDGTRYTMSALELDAETGVGLDGGVQGSDPQCSLSWSDDGGHSWSSDHWRSLGPIGKRRTRARWTRLGSFRSRVVRVEITDPVKVAILGAWVDIDGGVS